MQIARKYSKRLLVAGLIYLFFHVTRAETVSEAFTFGFADRIYFVYIIVVVISVWEILDRVLNHKMIADLDLNRSKHLVRAVVTLSLVILPLVVFASWISEYWIKPQLEICTFQGDSFMKDILQGQVLGWLIISERLFKRYHEQSRQLERDKALMQKELLMSQYVNLKNQIKPHFLFNSFSVLQSLIETDPEMAGKFLSRLSKMYRHILDSREDSMSHLDKELEILDAYLYLLSVRHEGSLKIEINVDKKYMDAFVPTMSLQMLMENVVKHNKFSKTNPLIIKIYTEDDYLIIKNQLNKKGSEVISTKVGLENIKSQYQLQSDKSIMIVEDEAFFTVKMPVLNRLRLA